MKTSRVCVAARPAAFGDDLHRHPVERVILIGQHAAIALAQGRAVAIGVVGVLFIVGGVHLAHSGLRREGPARLSVVAVIGHAGHIAIGVLHTRLLAVQGIAVARIILLQWGADGAWRRQVGVLVR
jgi:hypothetical protein